MRLVGTQSKRPLTKKIYKRPQSSPIRPCARTPSPQTRHFRNNVGIILYNLEGKVLCGQRADIPYWQLPQGGVDENESILEAAKRELKEELGIDASSLQPVPLLQPNRHFLT